MMARFLLSHAITTGAEVSPESEAIRFMGNHLSYEQLEVKSNQLAGILHEQGVSRGDRVGIFMNKGLESAISIYGILKAGGAYVPLDPFAPVNRIRYVIQDCGIRHLISSDMKRASVDEILSQDVVLDSLIGIADVGAHTPRCFTWDDIYESDSQTLTLNLTEQDLAYILYTSGSTGNPKGIMHTHRSGLSFAEWAANEYALTSTDRLSNHAPLHFDLSTFDFFASAVARATTVIISEALTKFPANLSKLMEQERISVWYSVPFALIQLMQRGVLESRDLSALRWLLFAGEVFPTKHLRQLMEMFPHIRFSNLYGPTETNVCTYYHVPAIPETDETIPIGKPCANVEDIVVDSDGQLVEPGEVGELLIRGGVVMKGYWGQPEKTYKGFYKRRVFGDYEDIFYRTGDLVRLDENGDYRYLGRKDRQIKTRGYRVELDEIEVALLSHDEVAEAAAYPIPDDQGSNLIVASVIPKTDGNLAETVLVEHLNGRLPPYAVPVKIFIEQDFPRTSTGKISRRELQTLAIKELADQA
jgi:amino acid adenylation domain-containing protein